MASFEGHWGVDAALFIPSLQSPEISNPFDIVMWTVHQVDERWGSCVKHVLGGITCTLKGGRGYSSITASLARPGCPDPCSISDYAILAGKRTTHCSGQKCIYPIQHLQQAGCNTPLVRTPHTKAHGLMAIIQRGTAQL